MNKIRPCVHPNLRDCMHVVLRAETRVLLRPAYSGRHKAIRRFGKIFGTDHNGKKGGVTIGRFKPAFLAKPSPTSSHCPTPQTTEVTSHAPCLRTTASSEEQTCSEQTLQLSITAGWRKSLYRLRRQSKLSRDIPLCK